MIKRDHKVFRSYQHTDASGKRRTSLIRFQLQRTLVVLHYLLSGRTPKPLVVPGTTKPFKNWRNGSFHVRIEVSLSLGFKMSMALVERHGAAEGQVEDSDRFSRRIATKP